MKLAVVGSGISGLVCAHLLHRHHDVTVFEAEPRLGGHSHTVDVEHEGETVAVDTGFIVFNDRNYPNFTKLLQRLDVPSHETSMSFSVRCDSSDLEYGGTSLNGLFAQRRNAIRPAFLGMIRDIRRFGREAPRALEAGFADATLGEYLERTGYGQSFVDHYLVPMGAAIWSSSTATVRRFPLRFFVRFFDNHGMLDLRQRPQWRTIIGGSRRYVTALVAPFRERIRLSTPVTGVARHPSGVDVTTAADTTTFDQVILACHSDQALRLLAPPTDAERELLGAIPYQTNDTVLHADPTVLPRRRRAWSAWNYRTDEASGRAAVVTYNMSILQHLPTQVPLCVSLNQTASVDPSRILRRLTYDHPVYSPEGVAAQQRHGEVSGADRVHFCGAYWGYGFHEDGVRSALAVCERFGTAL
ncbi:MAG: FAD-dependent oxidoreductase [Planctomycetota bacterium]